jgi:peroxiredoxin
MRKYIKPIIIVALLGIFGFLGYSIVTKAGQKKAAEEKAQQLPEFTFHTADGDAYASTSLVKGKPVLLVYFDPDCEGCQYEAYEIQKNSELVKDIQVLMVTAADPEKAKQFFTDYDLKSHSFIKLLIDKDQTFLKIFGAAVTPMQVLYNKDHRLVKIFKGEIKMEAIIKQLDKGPSS